MSDEPDFRVPPVMRAIAALDHLLIASNSLSYIDVVRVRNLMHKLDRLRGDLVRVFAENNDYFKRTN